MINQIWANIRQLNSLGHYFCNSQLGVIRDLFKVVVLSPRIFLAFVIGFENLALFTSRQQLLGLLFGQCFGVSPCIVYSFHVLWRLNRSGRRNRSALFALPFTLLSCKSFSNNLVKLFLSEGLGLNFRRRFNWFRNRRGILFRRGRNRFLFHVSPR